MAGQDSRLEVDRFGLELQAGQSLTSGKREGREVLLTPGVFLRVGINSSVEMISPQHYGHPSRR